MKALDQRGRQTKSHADASRPGLAAVLAAGAAYAAAEYLIVLLAGFFNWGRAEALLFFAVRPWLLIAAAAAVSGWGLRARAGFYAAALMLAALSESLFLRALGADPLPEAVRGLAAGAVLAAIIDSGIQLGRYLLGRAGAGLAAAALVLLSLIPNALSPYEALALGRGGSEADRKPDLMLLTGLPLMWGEAGPLDRDSRAAGIFSMLEREFKIRPLDALDARSLWQGRLLLLAQPRALTPSELAALDVWVRGGGRALILTDPMLSWPSELPIGDIRRPPPIGLLGPLLDHWGLRLDRPEEKRVVLREVKAGGERRRLIMFAPGRFQAEGKSCAVGPTAHIARCRIGKGRAILIADADMMHDRLWMGEGPSGAKRHARISDNPLIIADALDALARRRRTRVGGPVQWLSAGEDGSAALVLGLLPLLAAAAPAAVRRLPARG